MTSRKRAPSPTPSEGRSMRSFIRKPARFRSPQESKSTSRRSSSFMDTNSTDSSVNPAAKRGPGRPKGSTTKRKRSSSTSPSTSAPRVYQPAAFPSRPMRETPEERKAFDDATRAAMLAKFEEEDDGFGDDWADIEPGPVLETLLPGRHIVPVFRDRAKRACLANKSFDEFFSTQIAEIHHGKVPKTIDRTMIHTALEMCWRDLATEVFGRDVDELEDGIAEVLKEVIKDQSLSPRDSQDPLDTIAVKSQTGSTIAVSHYLPGSIEQPQASQASQASLSKPSDASPQDAHETSSSLDVNPDNDAVPVVQQYHEWQRHANRPLDVRMVHGVKYDNRGWNIDHPRGRPFATKDWRVHPQFNGNEQMLNISDSE